MKSIVELLLIFIISSKFGFCNENYTKYIACQKIEKDGAYVKNITTCKVVNSVLFIDHEYTNVTLLDNNMQKTNANFTGFCARSYNILYLPIFSDEVSNNLQYLSITNASLKKLSPLSLKRLPNLIVLNLANNKIRELKANIFINNLELKVVQLSHNKIEFIDSDAFYGLENLDYLDFTNNTCYKRTSVGKSETKQAIEEIKKECGQQHFFSCCDDEISQEPAEVINLANNRFQKLEFIVSFHTVLMILGLLIFLYRKLYKKLFKNREITLRDSPYDTLHNRPITQNIFYKQFETIDIEGSDGYSKLKSKFELKNEEDCDGYQEIGFNNNIDVNSQVQKDDDAQCVKNEEENSEKTKEEIYVEIKPIQNTSDRDREIYATVKKK